MLALVRTEVTKLFGSLGLALMIVAPGLVGFLVLLAVARSEETGVWIALFESFALPVWALFMLPMSITALAALAGQVEHRSSGLDHLLALPIRRWRLFAVKLGMVQVATLLMTALMVGFVYLGGTAGGVFGAPPQPELSLASVAWTASQIAVSALFLASIQGWIALRSPSFLIATVTGMAGTLVVTAVAMTGVQGANWFPVLGEFGFHHAVEARVDHRLLHRCHADAPRHRPLELRPHRARVDRSSDAVGADHAGHARSIMSGSTVTSVKIAPNA